MRANQLSYYPDGTGKQNNLYYGHPIHGPDYAELIAPFGGFGRRVDNPGELDDALLAGLAAVEDGKTAIINVVLNR
jgi:thiamine pyrophosphate-dependent acetolactate synthase large subunit-like protein